MKLKKLTTLSLPVSLLLLSTTMIQPAFAQQQCTTCSIIQAIDNLTKKVTNAALFFAKKNAEQLFEPNPYTATAITANKEAKEVPKDVRTTIATAESPTIERTNVKGKAESYPNPSSVQTIVNMQTGEAANIVKYYGNLCGSDYSENCQGGTNIYSPQQQETALKNANFSAGSLLTTKGYKAGSLEDQAAQNYIAYLADTVDPFIVMDETTRKQLKNKGKLDSPLLQKFRNQIRSYVAQLTMGVNNLNYIYAQNRKIPNLGKNSGLPNVAKDLSPMELDHKMATRRVGDPKWYEKMSTASPATVQRETLFVLAEMRNEMYQERVIQQRLLATMAALQIQFTTSRKLGLENIRSDAQQALQPSSETEDETSFTKQLKQEEQIKQQQQQQLQQQQIQTPPQQQ